VIDKILDRKKNVTKRPPNALYVGPLKISRKGWFFKDAKHGDCYHPIGQPWSDLYIYRVERENIELIL